MIRERVNAYLDRMLVLSTAGRGGGGAGGGGGGSSSVAAAPEMTQSDVEALYAVATREIAQAGEFLARGASRCSSCESVPFAQL